MMRNVMQNNARYFVVQIRNQWLIRYNGEDYGPYLTQAEATLFAVDAAQKLVGRGENAVVYFMNRNGRVRRRWACDEAA
jgi:hypothetical protein